MSNITIVNRIQIISKRVLGYDATLYFVEENDKFYLELEYRDRVARIEIADTDQEIANWFGIKFKIKISDINRTNNIFEFRVRLIADLPFGRDIIIIDEKVRINLPSLKLDKPDEEQPVLSFENN